MESTPVPQLRLVPTGEGSANREHFSVPRPLHFRSEGDFPASNSYRKLPLTSTQKPSTGEEVVLFAIHPSTIIYPIRKRVYDKVTSVLNSFLKNLEKKGLKKEEVIRRLQKSKWFHKLFDFEGIWNLTNVFKTYICHSDTLVVPLIFKEVYEAFSTEMERTYSTEVMRMGFHSDLDNRKAFIMGGIDFTEETMLSTYRIPVEARNNDLPSSSIWRITGSNPRNFHPISTFQPNQNITQSDTSRNREFFLNEQNLTLFTSFLPKLKEILRKKQEKLRELRLKLEQEEKETEESQRILLKRSYKQMHSTLEQEYDEFEQSLVKFENIFDLKSSQSKLAKSLDELNKNMALLDTFVKNNVL